MMPDINSINILVLLSAYLAGCFPSAVIVAKVYNLPSPLATGSLNPGATNMVRIGGKKVGFIVFLLDFSKGALVIALTYALNLDVKIVSLCAFLVFFGHVFSIFLKGKGGKGVATLFGILTLLNFYLLILTACTWLIIAKVFKISALAAIIALALMPLYAYLLKIDAIVLIALTCIAMISIYKHKSNIKRLLQKEEKPI